MPQPFCADGLDAAQELSISRGRVVLVNLWATWTPCLREIPDLLALETELPASDFRLLAISMDDAYSEGWVTELAAFPTLVPSLTLSTWTR